MTNTQHAKGSRMTNSGISSARTSKQGRNSRGSSHLHLSSPNCKAFLSFRGISEDLWWGANFVYSHGEHIHASILAFSGPHPRAHPAINEQIRPASAMMSTCSSLYGSILMLTWTPGPRTFPLPHRRCYLNRVCRGPSNRSVITE